MLMRQEPPPLPTGANSARELLAVASALYRRLWLRVRALVRSACESKPHAGGPIVTLLLHSCRPRLGDPSGATLLAGPSDMLRGVARDAILRGHRMVSWGNGADTLLRDVEGTSPFAAVAEACLESVAAALTLPESGDRDGRGSHLPLVPGGAAALSVAWADGEADEISAAARGAGDRAAGRSDRRRSSVAFFRRGAASAAGAEKEPRRRDTAGMAVQHLHDLVHYSPNDWLTCGRAATPTSPWAVAGCECAADTGSLVPLHASLKAPSAIMGWLLAGQPTPADTAAAHLCGASVSCVRHATEALLSSCSLIRCASGVQLAHLRSVLWTWHAHGEPLRQLAHMHQQAASLPLHTRWSNVDLASELAPFAVHSAALTDVGDSSADATRLAPSTLRARLESLLHRVSAFTSATALYVSGRRALNAEASSMFAVGEEHTWGSEGGHRAVRSAVSTALSALRRAAIQIQKVVRGWLQRVRQARRLAAATLLQARIRSWLAKQSFHRHVRAAVVGQRWWRIVRARQVLRFARQALRLLAWGRLIRWAAGMRAAAGGMVSRFVAASYRARVLARAKRAIARFLTLRIHRKRSAAVAVDVRAWFCSLRRSCARLQRNWRRLCWRREVQRQAAAARSIQRLIRMALLRMMLRRRITRSAMLAVAAAADDEQSSLDYACSTAAPTGLLRALGHHRPDGAAPPPALGAACAAALRCETTVHAVLACVGGAACSTVTMHNSIATVHHCAACFRLALFLPDKAIRIREAIAAVAVGDEHVIALTARQQLVAWGSNAQAQCGRPPSSMPLPSPALVATPTSARFTASTVSQVFAAGSWSGLLTAHGDVYTWGAWECTGTPYTLSCVPVSAAGGGQSAGATSPHGACSPVMPSSPSRSPTCGGYHIRCADATGRLVSIAGEVARSLDTPSAPPCAAPPPLRWAVHTPTRLRFGAHTALRIHSVAVGAMSGAALSATGEVWTWGAAAAPLHDCPTTELPTGEDADGAGRRAGAEGCLLHEPQLVRTGVAWQPSDSRRAERAKAQAKPTARVATKIAAGTAHHIALLADGSVIGWGQTTWGQLGSSRSDATWVPPTDPVTLAHPDDDWSATAHHEVTASTYAGADVAVAGNTSFVAWMPQATAAHGSGKTSSARSAIVGYGEAVRWLRLRASLSAGHHSATAPSATTPALLFPGTAAGRLVAGRGVVVDVMAEAAGGFEAGTLTAVEVTVLARGYTDHSLPRRVTLLRCL